MKLARIALRNIRRNKRRSTLSASATAIASMAIVFMFSLISGMKEDMEKNISSYVSGHVRIREAQYNKYEHLNPLHLRITDYEKILPELSSDQRVEAFSARINFPTTIYREEELHRAMAVGLNFTTEVSFMDLESVIIRGRLPENGNNEVIIGFKLAEELGIGVDDRITLLATTMRKSINAMTFKIAGIAAFPIGSYNKTHLMIPLDRVQYLLRMDKSVTEILVKLNNPREAASFAEELNREFKTSGNTELEVQSWKNISIIYGFMSMAQVIYGFIALIFFLLASTVLINTTMMVIFERMREIGTIAAMGMTGKEIVRLFFYEAVFLSIVGAFAGLIVGVGITLPLSAYGLDFGAAMQGIDIEISDIIYPRLNLFSTIFVFFYAVVVSSLASLIPSTRAAKIQPVEALRYTG